MIKAKLKLIALIAATVFLLVFAGAGASAYDVIQPNGSYCLDDVGVISKETKNYITERNKNLEQNCNGAQMCVVVIDSIGYADIEEYAYDVFTDWKIGREGEDNGVLILFVTGGENYWIMPGTGLENILNTGVLSSVINVYCEPYFAKGDYDTAVRKTFTRLNELICQEYGTNPEGVATYGSGVFTGGGSGQPISGYNGNSHYGWSCSDVHVPNYSFRSCNACSSCIISCGSCRGCGSCTGFGSIILFVIIVYVVLQVLRGMGRGGVRRVYRAPRPNYYGPRTGFTNRTGPGFGGQGRPGFGGPRSGGSTGARTTSGSGTRPGFGGFSGGGGGARSGGAGRSGSGGFSGGSGGTRGGGAGRR